MPSFGGNPGNMPAPPKAAPAPRQVGHMGGMPTYHPAVQQAPAPPPAPRQVSHMGGMPTVPRAAPARGQVPAARIAQLAAMRAWSGRDRAFMAPTDPITSIEALLQGHAITSHLQAQGAFNQDFTDLKNQGLLPAGAIEPQLNFPARGAGPHGGLSYETNHTVSLSPETVSALNDMRSQLHAWAQRTLIHELAHSMQTQQVLSSVPLREGGAQAYADAATPSVLGPLPQNDTNYSQYVRNVRAYEGAPWYMRGQFGQ